MRLQGILWAIGRRFCQVPSEELRDATTALRNEIHTMRLNQEESRRQLDVQSKRIDVTSAHIADCNQDRQDLRSRLEASQKDRLDMLRQITHDEDGPDLHLVKEVV